ncbi:hssA/2C/7E family protein [Dictyostelium discoideum AX4]|uniref:UPF0512 protein U n=1 Tax=Dictyostelium discoideum TaxID=44689 RepID=U512U_DICDI|nr:hssA/2C/7E family protein [Dictyostelium discoideum AX4]Q54FF2.2 RecName: Full=UPF0512 protein U [Dictyostelium discoideum]EAL61988.2 hssA/2C/7E family protein [Dictyostelium discoideum AX4]|eukprot:XP_635470.2 hssA/2C/7E family protein [Dictyostelium discoideum AX4]
MAIFKSISSISNPTGSMGSSIGTSNIDGLTNNNNSIACFDSDYSGLNGLGGLGGFNGGGCGGCGDSNTNIINIDIDLCRRGHRCC